MKCFLGSNFWNQTEIVFFSVKKRRMLYSIYDKDRDAYLCNRTSYTFVVQCYSLDKVCWLMYDDACDLVSCYMFVVVLASHHRMKRNMRSNLPMGSILLRIWWIWETYQNTLALLYCAKIADIDHLCLFILHSHIN